MTEYYSQKDCESARARAGRDKWTALGIFAAALTVCVILCARVSTLNAQASYTVVVTVSTLGGWAAILIWVLAYRQRKAAFIHINGMLDGQREEFTGTLGSLGKVTRIPGSIDVRRIPVLTDEGSVSLLVYAPLAAKLPGEGTCMRLETVSRYIVACEVIPCAQ